MSEITSSRNHGANDPVQMDVHALSGGEVELHYIDPGGNAIEIRLHFFQAPDIDWSLTVFTSMELELGR